MSEDFVRFDYVTGTTTAPALVRPSQVAYVTDEGDGLSAMHMLPAGILFVRMSVDDVLARLGAVAETVWEAT
jgi:hypothetical protein